MALGATATVLVCLAASQESPASTTPLDAWLNNLVAFASAEPSRDGTVLVWRRAKTEVPTSEEIRALERSVKDHPQSPDARKLEDARLLRDGKLYEEFTLYSFGDDWRQNCTYAGRPNDYYDFVRTKEHRWAINKSEIVLARPDDPNPGNRNFDFLASQDRRELMDLLTCGLATAGLSGFLGNAPLHATLAGKTWSAAITSTIHAGARELGYATTLRGTWGGTEGTLDSVDIDVTVAGEKQGHTTYKSGDWRSEGRLGRSVAHWFASNIPGVPPRRYEFRGADTIGREEFDKLVVVPVAGVIDPVRGMLTASSISDYAGPSPEVRTPGGERVASLAPTQAEKDNRYRVYGGSCL